MAQHTDNQDTGLNRFFKKREEQRKEKLRRRFEKGDFCTQNKAWRFICSLVSYVVQILSALTCYYGVYYALNFVTSSPIFAMLFTAVLLIAMLWVQRESSDRFWDNFWQTSKIDYKWIVLSASIALISAAGSTFGIYKGIEENVAEAAVITNDSTLLALQSNQDKIAQDIALAQKTRWKGTVTSDSQKAIKSFAKTQSKLVEALLLRQSTVDGKNEVIEAEHKKDVFQAILFCVILYLLLELIFEVCMSFASKYDYIKYLESLSPSELKKQAINRFGKQGYKEIFPGQIISQNQYDQSGQLQGLLGHLFNRGKTPSGTPSPDAVPGTQKPPSVTPSSTPYQSAPDAVPETAKTPSATRHTASENGENGENGDGERTAKSAVPDGVPERQKTPYQNGEKPPSESPSESLYEYNKTAPKNTVLKCPCGCDKTFTKKPINKVFFSPKCKKEFWQFVKGKKLPEHYN